MTPGSFDIATAREFLGTEKTRWAEDKARKDADASLLRTPPQPFTGASYTGALCNEMLRRVYMEAYEKRQARLQRTRGV